MKAGAQTTILVAPALSTRNELGIIGFDLPYSSSAAHGGGPALYCAAGTLNNCPDTGDAATPEEVFSCEGEARVAASCFEQTTSEILLYCPFHQFHHYEASKDEDHYLCGAEPTQEEVGHHS